MYDLIDCSLLAMAQDFYAFKYVGSHESTMTDNLAKEARQQNSPYVVSWIY